MNWIGPKFLEVNVGINFFRKDRKKMTDYLSVGRSLFCDLCLKSNETTKFQVKIEIRLFYTHSVEFSQIQG